MAASIELTMGKISCSFRNKTLLHLFDGRGETVDILPVGKLYIGVRGCRTLGHPHNKSDHLPVEITIFLILQPAGEDGQMFRFPGDLL